MKYSRQVTRIQVVTMHEVSFLTFVSTVHFEVGLFSSGVWRIGDEVRVELLSRLSRDLPHSLRLYLWQSERTLARIYQDAFSKRKFTGSHYGRQSACGIIVFQCNLHNYIMTENLPTYLRRHTCWWLNHYFCQTTYVCLITIVHGRMRWKEIWVYCSG